MSFLGWKHTQKNKQEEKIGFYKSSTNDYNGNRQKMSLNIL